VRRARTAADCWRRGLRSSSATWRARRRIDLICRDAGSVVSSKPAALRQLGGAAASITAAKQARLILAARHWLARHGEQACRFDCVLIQDGRIEWLKDAFAAD
jgi:putative endonuclease